MYLACKVERWVFTIHAASAVLLELRAYNDPGLRRIQHHRHGDNVSPHVGWLMESVALSRDNTTVVLLSFSPSCERQLRPYLHHPFL